MIFIIALTLVTVANATFFFMRKRLSDEGIQINYFLMPKDIFRVTREYRLLASTKGWSAIPPVQFWVCAVVGLALFGFAVYVGDSFPLDSLLTDGDRAVAFAGIVAVPVTILSLSWLLLSQNRTRRKK